MASFKPVAGLIPQYQRSDGELASGFFIQFEAAGTSTTIQLATDNTGGTLLTRVQLNSSGKPETGGGQEFIPHLDQFYKVTIFPTEADAIAKTNPDGDPIDNLQPIGNTDITSNVKFAENFDDFADAVTGAAGKELVISTVLVVASNITVSGLTLRFIQGGKLDPNTGITITLNCEIDAGRFEIFDSTALGLVRGDFSGVVGFPQWWGAVADGVNADRDSINQAATTAGVDGRITFPAGTYLIDASLVITCHCIFEPGAILDISTGFTVTFTSPEHVESGKRNKIFTIVESAAVSFANAGTVHAGWWGFSVSGTRASNTTALEFTADATVGMKGSMRMTQGRFLLNPTLTTITAEFLSLAIYGERSTWIGDNRHTETGTILDFQGLSGTQFGWHIRNTFDPNADHGEGFRMEDISFDGLTNQNIASPTTTVKGLVLEDLSRGILHNVNINKFHTGLSADGTFLTTYDNVSVHECHYGIFVEGSNAQAKFPLCNVEKNWIGLVLADGSGISLDNIQAESCGALGIYIQTKNATNIDDIEIRMPYFESNLGFLVEVGTPASFGAGRFNSGGGTITGINWNGARIDNPAFYPRFRNVTDLRLNIRADYIAGNDGSGRENHFDFDSTVAWSMPTEGAFTLGNSGSTASFQMLLTEFYMHVENTIAATHTLTAVDINIAPRNTPYTVWRQDNSGDAVILKGLSGQLFNGVNELSLNSAGATITYIRDTVGGENWRIISGGPTGNKTAFNPPSLAAGASTTTTVAVSGAKLGDRAFASFSLDTQGITLSAQVTSTDIVTVTFTNATGTNPLDLGSGDIIVNVLKT